MIRVSSPNNPRVREALRLMASSHERRRAGRCVLEGAHLVNVYCATFGLPDTIIASEAALARDEVRALVAGDADARTIVVPAALLARHSAMPADIGVLAVVATPPAAAPRDDASFTLLLEDIQDPGNVGSIVRTAAAAGVEQVLLSKGCAFAWSPKVLRAGQGAHFLTRVAEDVDLVAWCARFRDAGGAVAALVVDAAVSLYDAALPARLALAIGNEGAGLSPALVAAADLRVTLPMAAGNESLNAAAAAAAAAFEVVRRRAAAPSRR